MDAINNSLSPRAEFWQCLAQEFIPPRGEVLSSVRHAELTDDLECLAATIGLDIRAAIMEVRAALSQTNAESLLLTYSALFLVPPIPAKLNAGIYLDGTLLGPNTQMLVKIFRRHGVEQSPDMHDTPDHFATILEFLALLFQRADVTESAPPDILDDMEAVRSLLWRALSGLHSRVAETEQERSLPVVYSALLRIVKTALRDEQGIFFRATGNGEKETARRCSEKRETADDLVACKMCGKPVATAHELKVIIDRLHQCGLPSDHLELCPDCRDGTRGWKAGKIGGNLRGVR